MQRTSSGEIQESTHKKEISQNYKKIQIRTRTRARTSRKSARVASCRGTIMKAALSCVLKEPDGATEKGGRSKQEQVQEQKAE